MPDAPDPPEDDRPAGRPERKRPPMSRQAAIVTAVGGVAAALLVFLVMVNVARTSGGAGGGDGEDGKTKREFVVGRAGSLAGTVGRRGPLLIQDPLRGRQNIFVQFLGDDRWVAFDSHPPDAPLECQLKWEPAIGQFRDGCSGRTFPADGTGLVSYPTRVNDDDRVLVDLRSPQAPVEATTTTVAASTTAVPSSSTTTSGPA